VNHRLLVANGDEADDFLAGLQRLAYSADVAMTEDAQDRPEEGDNPAVALHALGMEILNEGLGHRQTPGGSHVPPRICATIGHSPANCRVTARTWPEVRMGGDGD